MNGREWIIQKRNAASFDSALASIVGPPTGNIHVVPAARLADAVKALDEIVAEVGSSTRAALIAREALALIRGDE